MNDQQPVADKPEVNAESVSGSSRRAVVRSIVAGAPAILVLSGRSAYAAGHYNGSGGAAGGRRGGGGRGR